MKRLVLETAGWILVVLGVAALVLPGPGLVMLVAGLALLSQQYTWAEKRLEPMRVRARQVASESVATIPRIALSVLGALTLGALGVLWVIEPDVPSWWPVADRWWLAGGDGTGISLLLSAALALGLIIVSIVQYRGAGPLARPGDEPGAELEVEPPTRRAEGTKQGEGPNSQP